MFEGVFGVYLQPAAHLPCSAPLQLYHTPSLFLGHDAPPTLNSNPQQNLEQWRQYNGRQYDFTLLDRNNGAGWDLAQKLLAKRNEYNRGRLSVEQALRHRYFLPELF